MPFVVDNSVVCGWFLESQATAYSDAVAIRLQTETALAPSLLQLEYTNVVRTACKRGRLIAQDARAVIDDLQRLPIEFDLQPPAPAALLSLALRYDLTAHDAVYLELALRAQIPIATQDEALAEAAWTTGAGVLKA